MIRNLWCTGLRQGEALASVSCLGDPAFVCGDDEQCVSVGAEARCEAIRYCSYVDASDRTEVWTINVSGLAGDRDPTWGLALAQDGSIYACGYSATPGSEWDLWVRRFTP